MAFEGQPNQPEPQKRTNAPTDGAMNPGSTASPPSLEGDGYGHLRAIASRFLSRERRDHTLQPTALVNEAYAKLLSGGTLGAIGRDDVVPLVARAMRNVLIDHARKRNADKRSGAGRRVPLDDALAQYEQTGVDLLALENALQKLEACDPALARIVELRFFGGLSEEEAAAELRVSARTVRRGWVFAKLFLKAELSRD